jgi:hypothetical protein
MSNNEEVWMFWVNNDYWHGEDVCGAINHFGDGQHPWADATTIEGFADDYIIECLSKWLESKGRSDEIKN